MHGPLALRLLGLNSMVYYQLLMPQQIQSATTTESLHSDGYFCSQRVERLILGLGYYSVTIIIIITN